MTRRGGVPVSTEVSDVSTDLPDEGPAGLAL
ncbi:hypothetical protein ACVWXB_008205 [Streptomyces sp. TE12347]